ncbi:MAG: MerR family transcriptional regulator [Ignavibacteriae bacterium]|nr:MerR family transcriptional regulator [Ignavibacteriota bacterium]
MKDPAATNPLFYTIGEAADLVGTSISTVRMYEREGLIIPLRRDSKHRRFSEADITRIRCMRKMINEKKVSIAGIRHMMSLIPCWKIKGCSSDVRQSCPAFSNTEKPCWMLSGKSWMCRSSQCSQCVVYREIANCETLKQTIAAHTIEVEQLGSAAR